MPSGGRAFQLPDNICVLKTFLKLPLLLWTTIWLKYAAISPHTWYCYKCVSLDVRKPSRAYQSTCSARRKRDMWHN